MGSVFAYGTHSAMTFDAGEIKGVPGIVPILGRNKVATGWVWTKHLLVSRGIELYNGQQKGILVILVQNCPDQRRSKWRGAAAWWHEGFILDGLLDHIFYAIDAVDVATLELVKGTGFFCKALSTGSTQTV